MSPRRFKVVYLDHCAQLSGGEIALARLLPGLLPTVDPVVVLAEDGPLVQRLQLLGVPVEVMPLDPRVKNVRKDTVAPGGVDVAAAVRLVPYVLRLVLLLRRERPDVVHTNSLKAAFYGGVAARLAGVPMVWHLRDRIAEDYLPRPAVRLVRLATRLLPRVVVANSLSTLSTVPPRQPGVVISNVVVHDTLIHEPAPRKPRTEATFGVVGRLAPWKGQDVFLRAFAQEFAGTDVRARLVGSVMFGEVAYEQSLRALVGELGIAGQVDFRGFREDVFAELAELDVLVHCSVTPEPFGQVVVEGMAAGLPVIAAAEGGPVEIVTDGVDGLLVPPGDPVLLAATMRRVHEDPELRERLATTALASSARFSESRAAEEITDLYVRVCGARPRSAWVMRFRARPRRWRA